MSALERLINWLFAFVKWSFRPIAVLLILTTTWYGFLSLVQAPPLDPTPVMIMIWITAAILILALFPSILENIRKVKVGDFEFELKETVSNATKQDFAVLSYQEDVADFFREKKGRIRDLRGILARALESPGKPILLTSDLRTGISKAALFSYLLLMDFFGSQVVVLFIYSSERQAQSGNTEMQDVMGVISGKKLLQAYYRRFPSLINIFVQGDRRFDNVLEPVGITLIPSTVFITALYDESQNLIEGDLSREASDLYYSGDEGHRNRDSLLRREVDRWLSNLLSKKSVNSSFGKHDLETVRQSLLQNDDFLIITESRNLETILILDNLARNISQKVLRQTAEKQ